MAALREFSLDASVIRDLYKTQHSQSGRHRCPACADQRKREHRFERTLAITARDGLILFDCKHCPLQGAIKENEPWISPTSFKAKIMPADALQEIDAPSVAGLPIEPSGAISEPVVEWFKARGISEPTLKKAGVYTAPYRSLGDAIHFPYSHKGSVYAVKVRDQEKHFSQIGSCSSWWGAEDVIAGDDLLCVEGECDRLALMEAGFNSVVSVPNGAPKQVSTRNLSPEEDRKFAYVWRGKNLYDQAKRIILACDNDEPGQALMEELSRRIGRARVWRVDFPEGIKDANEALIKLGAKGLQDIIASAYPWPIAGVNSALHYKDEVKALYSKGLGKGESTGIPSVDDLFTVVPGHLITITGIPGAGKSAFANQVMVNMAKNLGWRFAVQSTEVEPAIFISMLASLYMEQSFFISGNSPRMTEAEMDTALDWVDAHFIFLYSESTPDVEGTLDRLQTACLRYSIQGCLLDPASYLSRKGMGDDSAGIDSAGNMLEAFKNFGVSHDCAMLLIAHPYKMRPDADGSTPIPTGYSISGSASWMNRSDFGLSLSRPAHDRSISVLTIWKCKFSWTGREGSVELFYDVPTGRYSDQPFPFSTIYSALQSTNDPWDGL